MNHILFKNYLFFPLLMVLYLAASSSAESMDTNESKFSNHPTNQNILISKECFNRKVADVALKFYKEFNKNWAFNNNHEKNIIESQNWEYKVVNTESALTYIGKDNVEGFMDALKGLVNDKGVTECARVLQLVRILTAQEVMGDDIFKKYLLNFISKNRVLNKKSFNDNLVIMTLSCDYLLANLGIEICIFKKQMDNNAYHFDVGSFVHLQNIPDYFKFVEKGSLMGENLVYMGDDLFMGFGELYRDAPKTRKQIYTAFHEELLKSENFVSQYGKDFDKFLKCISPPSYTTLINYESIKLLSEK
ncbi:MAG: hypothetical protein ACOH2E_03565 [Candidatus Paracaedibacter sp.]